MLKTWGFTWEGTQAPPACGQPVKNTWDPERSNENKFISMDRENKRTQTSRKSCIQMEEGMVHSAPTPSITSLPANLQLHFHPSGTSSLF